MLQGLWSTLQNVLNVQFSYLNLFRSTNYFGATLWNSIHDDIKKISLSECVPQKIEAVLPGFLCLTNNLTLYTRMIGLIGRVHKRC